MRPRERILANLEALYRESFEKAQAESLPRRMEELDAAYQRDQLMLEVFLDIRDLLAQMPEPSPPSALEKLEALRRLTKLR